MATVDKNFKVKNGLVVNNGGTFGDAVTVGAPTLASHAATKEYVDSLTGGMPVGSTAPSSPTDGQLWFDTLTNRVNVYKDSVWITLAAIDDTLNLPQHIHDTAIDGTGFIVTTFREGGSFNSPQGSGLDGGSPSQTTWEFSFDGGTAVDNFN
jgi:hypothetical protein